MHNSRIHLTWYLSLCWHNTTWGALYSGCQIDLSRAMISHSVTENSILVQLLTELVGKIKAIRDLDLYLCDPHNGTMTNHNLPLMTSNYLLIVHYMLHFKPTWLLCFCGDKRMRFCSSLASFNVIGTAPLLCGKELQHLCHVSALRLHSLFNVLAMELKKDRAWSRSRKKETFWLHLVKKMKGAGSSRRAWRRLTCVGCLGFSSIV